MLGVDAFLPCFKSHNKMANKPQKQAKNFGKPAASKAAAPAAKKAPKK